MEDFKRPDKLPEEYLGIVSFDDTPKTLTISLDVKPLLNMRRKIKDNKEFSHLRSEIKSFVFIDLMLAWLTGWDESQYDYYFDRFASIFQYLFQDSVKNILDHANYGLITLERGDHDGLPYINFSIGSFANGNPQHLNRFFNALTLLKEPFYESSRGGSGENFGLGTQIILGQCPDAVVHIEKAIYENYFWVKYSGWCTAPLASKGK